MTTKKANKYDFKTWRESEKFEGSVAGERYKTEYSSKITDEGNLVLEEVGKTDLYKHIQLYKDECDINNIIKRYEAGDMTALQKAQGFFTDATNIPVDMADMLNKLNRAEMEFDKLPAHIKKMYGNDFTRFICTFDPRDLVQKVQEDTLVSDAKDAKEGVNDEQE